PDVTYRAAAEAGLIPIRRVVVPGSSGATIGQEFMRLDPEMRVTELGRGRNLVAGTRVVHYQRLPETVLRANIQDYIAKHGLGHVPNESTVLKWFYRVVRRGR